MNPVDEIFEAFGGSPTALARATGLKVQTVCDWRTKGPKNIPQWRRRVVLDAVLSAGKEISSDAMRYLGERAA